MKPSFFTNPAIKVAVLTVLSFMLLLSCTNKFFVAVVQPTNTKAIARNRIKVYIDLSEKSLLKNRIAILNRSSVPVSVYPVDIVLRVAHTDVALSAVMDYRKYVRMRYSEASKKCSESNSPYSCSGAIDKYFRRYLRVKPFEFGEIAPRTKRAGYFAFNLPDPFNTTSQAKKVAEQLRSKTNLLEGQIEVWVSTVTAASKEIKFVFPVNVITSSDEKKVLLAVRKNY